MIEKVNKEMKKPLMPTARKLRVGGREIYPISRMNSVKSAYNQIGVICDKKFVTRIDKKVGLSK